MTIETRVASTMAIVLPNTGTRSTGRPTAVSGPRSSDDRAGSIV